MDNEGQRETGPEGLLGGSGDLRPGGSGDRASHSDPRAIEQMLAQNVVTGNEFGNIAVPLFFGEKVFTFKPKEMRFLREFGPNVTLAEAAKKANVTPEFAVRLLGRKAVREYLQDKLQQIAIQEGWTVERWMAEGDKVWRGEKVASREQMEVWKEFGARILPKTKPASEAAHGEKPQITINIGAVDEAFQRQRAIQAEILDSGHGA